jgi:hypothetical protein
MSSRKCKSRYSFECRYSMSVLKVTHSCEYRIVCCVAVEAIQRREVSSSLAHSGTSDFDPV